MLTRKRSDLAASPREKEGKEKRNEPAREREKLFAVEKKWTILHSGRVLCSAIQRPSIFGKDSRVVPPPDKKGRFCLSNVTASGQKKKKGSPLFPKADQKLPDPCNSLSTAKKFRQICVLPISQKNQKGLGCNCYSQPHVLIARTPPCTRYVCNFLRRLGSLFACYCPPDEPDCY